MRKFSRKANCAALRRSNPELTRRIVPALELPSDWLSLGSFQIISQSLAKLVGRTNKFSRLRERAHWLSPARFPCGRSRYSGKWTSPDGSGQSELCVGTPKRTIVQDAGSNPRPSPNPRQSGHRKRGRKGQCGRLKCVRCRRQSHELGWMRELPEPLPEGIYRMPSVYGFVKSMRSLAPCIAAVCKLRCKTCLLCAGPCEEELAGHLEPNIHAHVYTRDIRNFV